MLSREHKAEKQGNFDNEKSSNNGIMLFLTKKVNPKSIDKISYSSELISKTNPLKKKLF